MIVQMTADRGKAAEANQQPEGLVLYYGRPEMGSVFEIPGGGEFPHCYIGEHDLCLRVVAHIANRSTENPQFRCAIIPPHQVFRNGIHFLDLEEDFVLHRIDVREDALRADLMYRIRVNNEKEKQQAEEVLAQQANLHSMEARIMKAEAVIVQMTADREKAAEANKARRIKAMTAGRIAAKKAKAKTTAALIAGRVAAKAARKTTDSETQRVSQGLV